MKKRNKNKKGGRVDLVIPRAFGGEDAEKVSTEETAGADENTDLNPTEGEEVTETAETEALRQDGGIDGEGEDMTDEEDTEPVIAPDSDAAVSEAAEVAESAVTEEAPDAPDDIVQDVAAEPEKSDEEAVESAVTEEEPESRWETDELDDIAQDVAAEPETSDEEAAESAITEEKPDVLDDSESMQSDMSQPPKEIEELEEQREIAAEEREFAPPAVVGKGKRKAKKAKGELTAKEKKKKKIIIIAVAVLVIIAVLVTAIVTPIMVINKDKIFVGKAEDFSNVDKGNYYVLTKDITYEGDLIISNPYSIDLNNHKLTVTGALVINHNNTDKTLNIGTKSGKSYTSGGMIQANAFNIACGGRVEIDSAVTAESVNISKAAVAARGGLHADSTLNVTDAEVVIDAVSYGESGAGVINNSTVSITGATGAAYALSNSTFLVATGEVKSVTADANSVFKCYTTVTGDVTGGKLAVMGKGSAASVVSGMEELWMLRDNDAIGQIILESERIKYIEQLATPVDMNVVLGKDTVSCIFATVNYAGRYKVAIDDNDPFYLTAAAGEQTVSIDITAYVADAGEHSIAVYACAPEGEEELYLQSEPLYYSYVHSFKLDMPRNLSITQEEDKLYVMFDKVNFAEQYAVYINGVRYEINGADFTGERVKWEVTDILGEVGAYSIRVGALAKSNGNIEDSAMTLTSYTVTRPQAAVTGFTGVLGESGIVNLSWTAVESALRYQISVFDANNAHVMDITVAGTGYTLAAADLPAGYTVRIKALAIGYYTDGAFSDAAVITQG